MKKLFIIIGLLAFAFASCYEDKGNYNYKKVLTVEHDGSSPETMSPSNSQAIIGEEYTYYPALKFSNYESPEDTLNLEYTWCCQHLSGDENDTLCVGRQLKWMVDRMATTLNVYLFIKDPKSKTETRLKMQISAISRFSKGWVFLHNYGGKTDMSFVYPYWLEFEDPEDPTHKIKERHYELYSNYLTTTNGADFGTNPTNIVWIGNDKTSKILVLQDEPVSIDGPTWKKEIKLADEFVGGYPEGGFKDMIFTAGASVLLANDGKVYRKEQYVGSSGQGEYQEFFITPYTNIPLQDITTGKDLIVDKFQSWECAWRGNSVCCYDKINGRVLYSHHGSGREASNVYYVPYSSKEGKIKDEQYKNEESKNLYVDLADMGEWELPIIGQKGESSSDKVSRQVFFLKNQAGEVLLQMVDLEKKYVNETLGNQKLYRPVYKNIDVRRWTSFEGATDDMIHENTVHHFCNGNGSGRNCFFFAKDNVIYCLDFDSFHLYKFYEYPAGTVIKFIRTNPRETELGVYTSDNTFRTFDITDAMLNNPNFEEKVIGEITGLKDVVCMKYVYANYTTDYNGAKAD